MTGARVLVADDDEVLRRLVTHVLNREGYQVVIAGSGEEVLAEVRSRRPDAIILDAMMPGIDGLEVLHMLRQGETTKDIPVIMLSARSQERDVVRGFDFGANDYLGKPFKPLELLVRLKRLLAAQPGVV
ncbi:MAG: response regulator [Rhodospirillaceae bacterium]|nr:response regulator [Rhodospirillaceae bacterium]